MASQESVWPNRIRCAAVFSFENCGEPGMSYVFGPDKNYYVSQGCYDSNAGTARVLRILERSQIKATFCIVGIGAEKRPDVLRAINQKGHEVALHGWDHRPYNKMTVEAERADIQRTVEIVGKTIGTKPVGLRTPDWNSSKSTLTLLHDMGFIWRGDSLDDDLPYIHKFTDGKNIVELPGAPTLDDLDNYWEKGYSPQEVFEIWRDEFDVLYDEGKFFHLVLHPLMTGRPGPSKTLEKIINHVKSREAVWIATAEEIAKYWLSKTRS